MPIASVKPVVRITAVVVLLVAASACLPDDRATATTGTGIVRGVVWHDLDSDGYRDANEPRLRNVVIAQDGTTNRSVTDGEGRWALRLPEGTHRLIAVTGWLPSACPGDLWCRTGRTHSQWFAVENQFVRITVRITAGRTKAGVDLGLEPDHGDPTGRSTSLHSGNDRGDGPARAHDLAVRHSSIRWYAGCKDPDRTRVCPVGTTLSNLGQIYNQGTAWVTDIRFVITVPPGTVLSRDPVPDRATPGPSPTRTGRTGRCADGSTWIEFALNRNLPPAGAVWFASNFKITGGPHSPKPYSTNYDHKAYVSISALNPADDDSPLRVDPRRGLDKGHNVNWPRAVDDDTSDAVEWNVA